MTDTIATIENMRKYAGPDVVAFAPSTGETCSADPADYFWLPESKPLTDNDGEPLLLVRKVPGEYVDVEPTENYQTRQLDALAAATDFSGRPAEFYKIKVTGIGSDTKWLTITPDQLTRIRTILADEPTTQRQVKP